MQSVESQIRRLDLTLQLTGTCKGEGGSTSHLYLRSVILLECKASCRQGRQVEYHKPRNGRMRLCMHISKGKWRQQGAKRSTQCH